jgi:hypothetical protein
MADEKLGVEQPPLGNSGINLPMTEYFRLWMRKLCRSNYIFQHHSESLRSAEAAFIKLFATMHNRGGRQHQFFQFFPGNMFFALV